MTINLDDLLADKTPSGTTETVEVFTALNLNTVKRMEQIVARLDVLTDSPAEDLERSLSDLPEDRLLQREYDKLRADMKPMTFVVRALGSVTFERILKKVQDEELKGVYDVAEFAAEAIVEPAMTPEKFIALSEKLGSMALAPLRDAVMRSISVAEVSVPKLPPRFTGQ